MYTNFIIAALTAAAHAFTFESEVELAQTTAAPPGIPDHMFAFASTVKALGM
jgi:hypothetical protein